MFFLYTGNVTNAGNNQLILSNITVSGANRSILNFSDLSDAELAGYRLRCGVWITFVLVTGFVAAAKFYFGYEGRGGLEILVFCGLLILLLSACLYTALCHRAHNNAHQECHVQERIASLASRNISNNESAVSMACQNPPPPYHIAILIPPTDLSTDTAPPSYDKVVP